MEHDITKTDAGWHCETCGQVWKGKPRAACPGVTVFENVPKSLASEEQLLSQNLKPKGGAVGCIKRGREWMPLYDRTDTEVADQNLPPIYTWENRPQDLQTPNQLFKYNRKPGDKPRGCIWNNGDFLFLYNWE